LLGHKEATEAFQVKELQLKDRLDGLAGQVQAVESKFSAELVSSQVQVEASLSSGLSNLRQDMQKDVADLRMTSQAHREANEAFRVTVLRDIETKNSATAMQLNNRLKDVKTKGDATALQLKDRLDGLTGQVVANESKFSAELATSEGQVEASLSSGLSNLRQDMQKDVADVRMTSQAHREATEAFQVTVMKDIETKNDATALQLNSRLDDIETKSDTIALQLKDLLDDFFNQVRERTTKLNDVSQKKVDDAKHAAKLLKQLDGLVGA
jgi:hypothetical protein